MDVDAVSGTLQRREVGRLERISHGVAQVSGLPGVASEELVRFPGSRLGMTLDLDDERVGVVLLDKTSGLDAGDAVRRTGRVMDVPVGEPLLGRVLDPAGRVRDGGPELEVSSRLPIERPAPDLLDRAPVSVPLQTGIKVIDAMIPIGRGQRELIVGDRRTGKSTIAIDTVLNQQDEDVLSIYCAIGQRSSSVAQAVAELRDRGALERTIVIATTGADPAGLRFIAPYAAMSIAEHFMQQGRDTLVVFDDLTRHARAYREISLLLRRPPGREAFPGDIFYIHSRLLERATHLSDDLGGGSITALPIVETQAQNISAYIPTNLISITDGQIFLSPRLFRLGVLPAVDVGLSVSRVGGKAQLPSFREVGGDLRLSYSKFEELERFSRYGARLEEERRKALVRGRRVREVFKQAQHDPLDVASQIAILLAVKSGLLDELEPGQVRDAEAAIRAAVQEAPDLAERATDAEAFEEDDAERFRDMARDAIEGLADDTADADEATEVESDEDEGDGDT
ncbi:MAG: alternate F1F0 ATPase, F1 subunit alpha [Candidatus Limnocylindrales bacterium]